MILWHAIALAVGVVVIGAIYYRYLSSREIIGDAIIISTSVFFIYMFYEFLVYGKIYAWEPHEPIAAIELFLSIMILIIGIDRLTKDWGGGKTEDTEP